MFCPECGKLLNDGQKFCPECGTPVEVNETEINEMQTGQDTFRTDTGTYRADAGGAFQTDAGAAGEGTGAWQTQGTTTFEKASFSGAGAGNAKNNNSDKVMRIVSGVFAVIFLLAALRRVPYLFTTIFGLRFGLFIAVFLGFASALVMSLSTAAAAWKWNSKLRNLVFGGAVLSVVLKLLSLIVQMVVNLISYDVLIDWRAFLYWLGYVAVTAALFGLMYFAGSAPVLGDTRDGFMSSINEGFSELSGAAKDLQSQRAQKNTARQQSAAAGYQAPPAGGTGYQTPPPAGAGTPGYGIPPMSYGMPTTPPRGRIAKKTNRSLLMYILLSIVTCGIYPYFFIYNLAKDVNDLCEGDGESTSGLLTFILLGIVTCGIYTIIWWYKLANRLQANGPRYNVPIQENGTTYIMWVLFGSLLCGIGPFIALNFVIRNTNKLCTVYNQYNGLR